MEQDSNNEAKNAGIPTVEMKPTRKLNAAHSALPWKQHCFLVTSARNEHVTHTGMGNLPPSRSSESEANAEFIVRACNSHDALVEACEFIKAYLAKLENDGGYYDPLTEARQLFHAPLHAKLDAALALAAKE